MKGLNNLVHYFWTS